MPGFAQNASISMFGIATLCMLIHCLNWSLLIFKNISKYYCVNKCCSIKRETETEIATCLFSKQYQAHPQHLYLIFQGLAGTGIWARPLTSLPRFLFLTGQQQHLRCGLFSGDKLWFILEGRFYAPELSFVVNVKACINRQPSNLNKNKSLSIGVFSADIFFVVFAPTPVLMPPQTSLVAVRCASKKSGGSSKNLGGRSPGKRYGYKKVEGGFEYLLSLVVVLLGFHSFSPGLGVSSWVFQ